MQRTFVAISLSYPTRPPLLPVHLTQHLEAVSVDKAGRRKVVAAVAAPAANHTRLAHPVVPAAADYDALAGRWDLERLYPTLMCACKSKNAPLLLFERYPKSLVPKLKR